MLSLLPLPSLYFAVTDSEMGDVCGDSDEDCIALVLVLFMSSLTLGIIPFFALAAHLVWRHYKLGKDLLADSSSSDGSQLAKAKVSSSEVGAAEVTNSACIVLRTDAPDDAPGQGGCSCPSWCSTAQIGRTKSATTSASSAPMGPFACELPCRNSILSRS